MPFNTLAWDGTYVGLARTIHIYGHTRCVYTVLANPKHTAYRYHDTQCSKEWRKLRVSEV
jgi:hypothetical protein